MHIHILGICGTFMGGIAVLAKAAGHRVTGCDAQVYPPMSTQLEQQGIQLVEGFEADQLALGPDLFVIGNVVSRGNPLMEAILDRALPYLSGPQWLAENILCHCRVLAVAGTHGKTTTTSLVAWLLEQGGIEPGFLIGGVPANFGVSARLPGGWHSAAQVLQDKPWFVIEADEYDTAFFDKRSKFVHYRPRVAILNNLEYDHADIFPDVQAIKTQFHHLIRMVPSQGRLVVNAQDMQLKATLALGCWTPVEFFGDHTHWQLQALEGNGLALRRGDGVIATLDAWVLLGEHNRLNALAALLAVQSVGMDPAQTLQYLAHFKGVRRRMEVLGTVRGVTVYDDFAHHPTAIQTTLAGLRQTLAPGQRILAVIEPRSNTMKLGVWAKTLATGLAQADLVFCYSAQLGWDVKGALSSLGERVLTSDNIEDLVQHIAAQAESGDQVLVMSNGGFGGLHARLLEQLALENA